MSINPTKQNIMELFSTGKQYYIDFYQRDYQWKTDQMARLLDDLFYRFDLEYKPHLDPTDETISRFDWYYLNAYVTNEYRGRTYIVDGQQRLTSLTLILIKLYHLAKELTPDKSDVVKQQILGAGLDGPTYWMGQGERTKVLEDLFNVGERTTDADEENISITNMYENYRIASNKLNGFLTNAHKFEAFLRYFLRRVMVVRIDINNTEDVPMVFEVINDRGVRLKPYEVLKGKLLGQIAKEEIDSYHDVWQKYVHRLQRIDENEVDNFFRFYFRSKYVDTRGDYRAFDGEYHKTIYEDKWNDQIKLKQNAAGVKTFVKKDLDYFADLYIRIVEDSKRENSQISQHLFFNDLNNQDRQFLLILSACETNDPDETAKIQLIAQLFDHHFTLLQLTGTYDSNRFTESLIQLNKSLRNQPLDKIAGIYKAQITADIASGLDITVQDPFDWKYFKDASLRNMGQKFLKYYLARIEHFVAKHLEQAPQSYYDLVLKSGWKWGYHIEHILAHNAENLALFEGDEDVFYVERNRLGALLLLLGRDNQASQNEPYKKKLKTYSHSLFWNRTLLEDFYHKNKNFEDFIKQYDLDFEPIDIFDKEAIEKRQKLLFELTKLIWKLPSVDVDTPADS